MAELVLDDARDVGLLGFFQGCGVQEVIVRLDGCRLADFEEGQVVSCPEYPAQESCPGEREPRRLGGGDAALEKERAPKGYVEVLDSSQFRKARPEGRVLLGPGQVGIQARCTPLVGVEAPRFRRFIDHGRLLSDWLEL